MSEATDPGVRSLHLALQILEAVAFGGSPVGVTQIAQRVGATKGSVYRHLSTFVDLGYLVQDPHTSQYSLGTKTRLLSRMSAQPDLADLAAAPMQELRDEVGHSVVLSAMSPRGAFVISTVPSRWPIEIGVRPGSELSFHASAQGRVILAFSPRPFQQRTLSKPLASFTSKTATDPVVVEDSLHRVVRDGFAVSSEQVLLGISAVAAPIFNHQDACVAAVALVGSIQHLPEEIDQRTTDALRRCAQSISHLLGHGGSSLPAGASDQRLRRRKA